MSRIFKNDRYYYYLLFFLVTVLGGIPVVLGHFFNDISMYMKVSSRLLDDAVLYKDVVDNKPPLIYYTFALVFYLYGAIDGFVIKVLSFFVHLAAPFLVYAISKELFSKKIAKIAGLVAVFTFFSGFNEDFINANTESYMNVFVLWGIYYFVKDRFNFKPSYLFLTGFLTSIAFLYRLQAGIYLPLFFAALLWFSKKRNFFYLVSRLFFIGIGFIIPIIVVGLYFYSQNALYDLYFWIYKWNTMYIQIGMDSYVLLQFTLRTALLLLGKYHLIILSALAVGILIKKEYRVFSAPNKKNLKDKNLIFLLLFFFLSFLTYFIGGRFYGHYFVQALPSFAILTGYYLACYFFKHGINSWQSFKTHFQNLGKKQKKKKLLIIILLTLPTFGFWIRHIYLTIDYQISKTEAQVKSEPVKRELKVTLRNFLDQKYPNVNPVFIWGESQPYFSLNREPATRFIKLNYQMGRIWGTHYKQGNPEMNRDVELKESWDMLFEDLKKNPPKIFLVANEKRTEFTIDHYPRLRDYLLRNYRYVKTIENYKIYVPV